MKLVSSFFLFLVLGLTPAFSQNHSVTFDGIDDVLTFPQCQALTGPNFTIEGWVKSAPSDQLQVVMMAFQDNLNILNANVTLEMRNAGLLRFNYRAQATTLGGYEIYSKTVIQDGKWHHFAAVKEANQRLLLYIDGFLETVSCFPLQNITAAPFFEIGRNKYDGASQYRWLDGSVDDFKIWFKAKTAKEIYEGFRKESSGSEQGLYSNYKLDEVSDTIFDCSTNKRHGIIQNIFGAGHEAQFTTNIPAIQDVDCFENANGGVDVDIKVTSEKNEMVILPNPTMNEVRLRFRYPVSGQIIICNTLGQLVLSEQVAANTSEIKLSAANWPSGNYILNVVTPGQILTGKFEKL